MRLVHRHNGCVAVTLFRWGRRQVELVWCPSGEVIEPHVHQKIDSTLVILGGEMFGRIGERQGRTGWYDFGRRFRIPARTPHQATVIGRFCMFLNLEEWSEEPTSAAVDFTDA